MQKLIQPLSEKKIQSFSGGIILDQTSRLKVHKPGVEDKNLVTENGFQMNMININKMDKSRLENFLKQGDRRKVGIFVNEFFCSIGIAAIKSVLFRQYLVMDMYFMTAKFLEEQNLMEDKEDEPFANARSMLYIVSSYEKTKQYITCIIKRAIELRDKKAKNHQDDIVKKACEFICENYADDTLSLNTLASYVNLSPNHLSMVFSRQTGKPFIKYLTDYRMEKAKDLLRCTSKKNSEISIQVGYKDPHYFSYIFKKTQRMTPTQYRME